MGVTVQVLPLHGALGEQPVPAPLRASGLGRTDGTGATMSHTPPPPQPPHGEGGPPASPQPSADATVVVPSWVSGDWAFALRVAALGHLLLLLGGAVVALLVVLRQISAAGLDLVEWGPVALTPLLILLRWAGGGAGTPILLSGAIYLFIAYTLVCRRSPHVATIVTDGVRAFAAAAKVGLVAGLGLLIVGILLNSLAEDLVVRAPSPGLAGRIDLTSLVFTSVFVGLVAALFALVVSGRTTLARLLGLNLPVPTLVRSGVLGGRRTLLIGALGSLALATLGSLLDTLTQGGTTLGFAIAVLLDTIIEILVQGIDQAVLLLLGATKFLHAGGYVWAPLGSVEAWMWLAIPILLAAYVAGGVRAAQVAAPGSQAQAARAALLVGPTVAAVGLLVAVGWAGQGFIDDIVPIAILLPSLWGVVAVAGGWLWGNQRGLPGGLVVQRPATPTPQRPTDTTPAPDEGSPPATAEQPAQEWVTPPQPPPAEGGAPPPSPPADEWPPPAASDRSVPDEATMPLDEQEATRPLRDDDPGPFPPPDPGSRRGG